jgi:hypothetical protein
MNPEDIHTTDEEAYKMATSVALNCLQQIMLDEDVNTNHRIWAAEAILENQPSLDKEKTTSKTDGE